MAKKKIRRVRTFARTASKSMEKNLINNAKKLKLNPNLILPDFEDSYSNRAFRKICAGLKKIEKIKDDNNKLEKISNKKNLIGAIAGTILIANSEKAPYLGVAKLPIGDITYAQRGKSDKFKLIAAQHFDNPILKIFGIRDIALKKGLYIYSWDEGFFSSGIKPAPPKKFVDFILKKIGYKTVDNLHFCNHIDKDELINKKVLNFPYIIISWKSANIKIGFCEKCINNSQNTLFNITKYMVNPDLKSDFSINIITKFIGRDEIIDETKIQLLDEYFSGNIGDIGLIKENIKKLDELLKESNENLLILDNKSYGTNIELFIKALKPNKYEIEALRYILNAINEPLILKDGSPNKILELFWNKYGFDFIKSKVNDDELAKNFYNLGETPSNILELVYDYIERQNILSKLPKYKSLPHLASYVDNLVRTFKTYGKNKTLIELKNIPKNTKEKSINYALLLIFNKANENKWKFSNVEVEYGEYLVKNVKDLLFSDSGDYHKYFKELIRSTGSSEEIDEYLI